MAARDVFLKCLRQNVRSVPTQNPSTGPLTLSPNQPLRRHFSEYVLGSFLDKSEVTDRVVSAVKNFQQVESSKATPLLAGLAVAAAAYAGRYGIRAWHAFKARPPTAKLRKFYEGGFQPTMTRREAALTLGVRESTPPDKVKEAHRRVMVANHPDAGGSHYLASKINEAKDVMLGKIKGSGSAF